MASLGMPKTTQLFHPVQLFCPASFISSNPFAPSSPIPVMMMPIAFLPHILQ